MQKNLVRELNVWNVNLKNSWKIKGEYLDGLEYVDDCLVSVPNAWFRKKTSEVGLHYNLKKKNILLCEWKCQKSKIRQSKKIFAKDVSDKIVWSEIYKELLKL